MIPNSLYTSLVKILSLLFRIGTPGGAPIPNMTIARGLVKATVGGGKAMMASIITADSPWIVTSNKLRTSTNFNGAQPRMGTTKAGGKCLSKATIEGGTGMVVAIVTDN